jgi:hypothetical protein
MILKHLCVLYLKDNFVFKKNLTKKQIFLEVMLQSCQKWSKIDVYENWNNQILQWKLESNKLPIPTSPYAHMNSLPALK